MYNYTKDYVDSIINKDNSTEITDYIKTLDKMQKKYAYRYCKYLLAYWYKPYTYKALYCNYVLNN